jgi:alanine-synthesizing transaminase
VRYDFTENIGNPGPFGFNTPDTMGLAMIENPGLAEPCSHQQGIELLASLRLCSNVAGHWAVQTALGGCQGTRELVRPGGRLYESRQAVIDALERRPYPSLTRPMGARYAFIRVRADVARKLDDQQFALELLETRQVLVAPGGSFNTDYNDHFRITTLPEADVIGDEFDHIDALLERVG